MSDLIPYNGDLTIGDFRITKTGLHIEGTPSFDQWHHVGVVLGNLAKVIQLAIGDWIRYGDTAYGEKYSQAIEDTDLEYSTLSKYCFVANTFGSKALFPLREKLPTWTHIKYLAEVAHTDGMIDRDLIDFGIAALDTYRHVNDKEMASTKFRHLLLVERDGRANSYEPAYVELVAILERQRAGGYDTRERLLTEVLDIVQRRLPADYRELVDDIFDAYEGG